MGDKPLDSPPWRPVKPRGIPECVLPGCGLWITPQDIPLLSGLIQREIITNSAGRREQAFEHCDLGESESQDGKAIAWIKANYAKPLRSRISRNREQGVSTLTIIPGVDRR